MVGRGQHPAVAGRDHVPGMKGETGNITVGLAEPFPLTVPKKLAAGSARASSTTCKLCRRAIRMMAAMSHGMPT